MGSCGIRRPFLQARKHVTMDYLISGTNEARTRKLWYRSKPDTVVYSRARTIRFSNGSTLAWMLVFLKGKRPCKELQLFLLPSIPLPPSSGNRNFLHWGKCSFHTLTRLFCRWLPVMLPHPPGPWHGSCFWLSQSLCIPTPPPPQPQCF